MLDVIDVAKEQLESKGYEGLSLKRLDRVKEGIILRRIPGAVTDRYMDDSESSNYLFQVLVKREDERRAIDECEAIADYFRKAFLPSQNGSYEFVSCDVYTEPQELDLSDGGYYIWQTRIRVLIHRKG